MPAGSQWENRIGTVRVNAPGGGTNRSSFIELPLAPPTCNCRFVGGTSTLFDHLIGKKQESLAHREAKCLGRLEVDGKLEFVGRLCGQFANQLAPENAINIGT